MQIRKIHIDGFGVFADKEVSGFARGINVVFGHNEFGKTTLLEFIRRTLFGYGKSKAADYNPYPSLRNAAYGGRLFCELANGESVVISRNAGPQGGNVSVVTDSRTLQGQEDLNSLLGHASKEIYLNIFAFGLEELQIFGSLQGEEIKNRIYGAGLGLGTVSLPDIEGYFQKTCDDLFTTPKGKTKKMVSLFLDMKTLQQEIGDIQSGLACYDELQHTGKALEEQKHDTERQIREAEERRRVLETRQDMYPLYVELIKIEAELEKGKDIPDFPEHAFEILGGMKSELKIIRDRITEENEFLERLRLESAAVVVNEELLRLEREVAALRNMTEQLRTIRSDKITVREHMERLDDQIQAEIKALGREWNEGRVVNFSITEGEKQEIQVFREAIDEARKQSARAREKLEDYREEKAREDSRGFNVPEWLNVVSYSLLGLGVAGLILGVFLVNVTALFLSTIVLALGGVSLRMIAKSRQSMTREDLLEPTLQEKVKRAREEDDRIFARWRGWLKERNFDDLLSPLSADKLIASMQQVKLLVGQRADLEKRLSQMRETENKAASLLREIAPSLKVLVEDSDICVGIDLVKRAYEEAEKARIQRTNLQFQIEALEKKIDNLREQLREREKNFLDFIHSAGAENEPDFEVKRRQTEKRNLLEKTASGKRAFIHSKVGVGESYDRFLESLRKTHPEEIQQEFDAVCRRLQELQGTRDTLNQEIGETRRKIRQMASGDDLLVKQSELEIKKEQLNLCFKEWAASRIAILMLERCKRKYERERQPEVVRAASEIFAQITEGKYRRIFKSSDSPEIFVDDLGGARKRLMEMSRGTREQLYLAMRLGLIEQYEMRSEPLPMIMDDVLVNFDDPRKSRLIEILARFAEKRQVIVLSCHHSSLDAYKRVGARQIEV